MKRIFAFLCLVFLLCGCQNNASSSNSAKSDSLASTEDTTAPKVYRNFDKSESANYDVYDYLDEDATVSDKDLKQIARAEGRFITIEDFYIEKDAAKPLSPTVLNDSQFSQLQDSININSLINEYFRLFHLISYDEWVSFRKITDKSLTQPYYYCIMENETTKERLYLLFFPLQSTFACMNYLLLDSNGVIKTIDNENHFCQIEEPDFWLSVIAKCDLQF